ncbi:dimethylsulfonioproprionate lyase family protein [Thalassovita taeanensis]|uniref:Dimethylsulfoniopropionate lyase DddL n=1 Tax=Thalassovita taeanensis TaxID=657014 RepID=A0A1H9EJ07_9RHOB|nr:dimethylsulfonioproprionate lyase family protein [Thalassovita taeanensis]SEQ25649.1 dimethylsulfoniopropionate lyase DddL [Thalassovita taeanensis]
MDVVEPVRLTDQPDWLYLLREFYEMYRFLPAGGSRAISSHQRQVREAISRLIKANPDIRLHAGTQLPVTAHLRRALDEGRTMPLAPVSRALDAVRPALRWQYGYDKLPKGLARKYGYAEIAGPSGPVASAEVILGVVLFAPGCTYPAHAHQGITESYICVSGSVSENDYGVYAPGSSIYNPPGHEHRITVSEREPALLAYAWIGAPEVLAGNVMTLGRKAPTPKPKG